MNSVLAPYAKCKYGISPIELKEARKLIIKDIIYDNFVENPIEFMTLRKYFQVIKGVILSACDKDGVVRDRFGKTWYGESKNEDQRNIDPIFTAKSWMDGRGLFTEHFNGNTDGTEYGDCPNLSQHDQNQWYHEDRLDNPSWFKQCVLQGIGAAGHPTECLTVGNITPSYEKCECWTIRLGGAHSSDYYVLKAYLFLRKHNVPVYIYSAQRYLTNKQINRLVSNGYLLEKNYRTGYWVNDNEEVKNYGYTATKSTK